MPSPRITLVAAAPDIGARLPCRSVDPEVFYDGDPEVARARCRRCPAQPDCLRFALAHDRNFGMWGGFDDQERRRLAHRLGLPPVGHPDLAALLANLAMPEPAAAAAVDVVPPPAAETCATTGQRRRPTLTRDRLAAAIDREDHSGRTAAHIATIVGCSIRPVARRRRERETTQPLPVVDGRPPRAAVRYGWPGGGNANHERQSVVWAAARHYRTHGRHGGAVAVVAAEYGVAPRPVQEAVTMLRWAPDVAADVEAGWVSWSDGRRHADRVRRAARHHDLAA